MANFYNRFLDSVRRWPEGIAVEVQHSAPDRPRDRYTFSDLRLMSDTAARWVTERLPPGAHCALLAPNGPRWQTAFMGVLAAGGVVVPLDTTLSRDQVRKLLEASDSDAILTDPKYSATVNSAAEGLPLKVVLLEDVVPLHSSAAADQAQAATSTEHFFPAERANDDLAGIFYSSGTTGDPKGVMLTHGNLSEESDAIFEVIGIGPNDAILGILPLFHVFALMSNVLLPMAGGARVVFLESLNTTDLLAALPLVNIFACVPQFFYLIHDRIWKEVNAKGKAAATAFRAMLALSRMGSKLGLNLGKVFFAKVHHLLGGNIRFFAVGGSRFDPAIGREFEALGFTMLQGYGLTETSGAATYTPPGNVNIASVGRALPNVEVQIANSESATADEHGQGTGEILIRGPIVMKGYYNRPDATATALDAEGWLHTGDLGHLDLHGNLFITGRVKELIVLSSGKNIYPEEIEAHYLKSPLIKEICVLGLESKPGEPASERLHGVVVANFDELKARKIVNSREALRFDMENLSVQLPSTKRILSYELWQEELPRTTTRKIKRFEVERRVRERLARGEAAAGGEEPTSRPLSESDQQWLVEPEVTRALEVVRQAAKGRKAEIHPADNLELDLGLDSMERVELLVALERELGGNVEDSVVSQVYTVRELVNAVRQSAGTEGKRAGAPAWEEVLHQDVSDPEVTRVRKRMPITTAFWFMATRLAHLLGRDFFHLRVEGIEKLPKNAPFILAPNHQSFLDPPMLISALPWGVFRNLFYVGTSEIFGAGVWRRLARSLKLIPVDPDAHLVPAMQAAAYGLKHGKVLVLYPEGERSIDGTPKVFKKGAAILASHLKVPIYPVALDGFYEAWPRGHGFQKFTRTRIVVGDPILPPPKVDSPERTYEELTRNLRARVVAMWDKMHEEMYAHEEPSPSSAD